MSTIDRNINTALMAINDKRTAVAVKRAFDRAIATAAVTAAGTSSQANSTPIESAVNYIATSSASTKGVRLPTPQPNDPGIWLLNTNATYDVLVYPDVGGTINALSANAAYTLPVGQACFAIPESGTQWRIGIVGATSAQIAYLTGSVAGTATASKALVLDANKSVDVLRAASYMVGASGSEVAFTPDTEVVTATNVIAASESGRTYFLNSATEFVSTLPAPALGLQYTFIVTGAPSGASYTVVTNSSGNIIKGLQLSAAGDAGDTGTADDTITFVDGQAVAGDRVDVICDGTYWYAYAKSKVAAGITFTQAS